MDEPQLPQFPNFTSLGPHHQAAVNNFVKNHHPYSDYNFISLWSWDHENKLRLSTLNDNLVIRFQDYTDPDEFYYSFLGVNQADETVLILLDHSRREGKNQLKLIPETAVNSLRQPEKFAIAEDRDSFDYIIATKTPEDSEAHQPKRREVHRFLKEHGQDLQVNELDISNPKTAGEILAVAEQWSGEISSGAHFNPGEIAAIRKILSQNQGLDTSNLHVVGMYMGGELSAFCIAEILEDGFAMGHYAKTNKKFRRMGAALDHFTAESLAKKGVVHFNQEQDLGIEGLRQSKMSKQPVFFLKKYTIALK